MATNILFVFEGESSEDKIVGSLNKHVLGDGIIVTCSFAAEIYQFYKKIRDDRDLDTFSLIKERDKESLKGYKREDFAEIYLFFDYDAHSTLADDDVLKDMLSLFNNETEAGKLYISYPMVESIRHIVCYDTFHLLNSKCKGINCLHRDDSIECEACKNEPHYKAIVGRDSLHELKHFDSDEKWIRVIKAHLSKMNYLVNGKYELPNRREEQEIIFAKQYEKHINKRCPEVAVLSAFPIFVHDYYGNEKTRSLCAKPAP